MMQERKRAIVMGATSGLGMETARILAARGWLVGIAGRRSEQLEALAREHTNMVSYRAIDVNDPDAPAGLQSLIGELGGMDLYFHSSGIGYQNVALDEGKELSTIATNCMGMARMVGAAFRYFVDHPHIDGHIAVISSIARTKGLGAAPAYSASKRFTSHYLESLEQLIHLHHIHNIRITDIRPGFVRTPLIEGSHFPMQLNAYNVAHKMVRAIERRKGVVTINLTYRLLVFFWQLIPRWLWVRLPHITTEL